MNFSGLKLVSSNEDKLREFRSFGLTGLSIEKGLDLREVDAEPVAVALYKALEAGEGHIVEDTSLAVLNARVGALIRFQIQNLSKYVGRQAVFEVFLAVNQDGQIKIYSGVQSGMIVPPNPATSTEEDLVFGFDNMFMPNDANKTLHLLAKEGRKSEFSARRMAVDALLRDEPIVTLAISDIKPWEGDYQK
jgi:inosine/xanthosine triphosphate pyrophosphatase family protein